ATLAAADLHGPINGIRFQLIRRFPREGAVSRCWSNKTICRNLEPPSCFRRRAEVLGSNCWSNKTICKNLEPPSCFRRAKVLGLLIPASCSFHVRANPYHTELRKHRGIVGRA